MPAGIPDERRVRPSIPLERVIALSIAVFLAAQVLLLEAAGAIPARLRIEIWVVTFVLAALAARAWSVRRMLPAHADMLLLMLAWGGFGMLWGWSLDGGLSAMQARFAHHQMTGGAITPVYWGFGRLINWMNFLMLLFAFPPSLEWARCLVPYRSFPLRLAWVLVLDAAGMILGMMAGGRLLGHPLGMLLAAPALAHHLGMLLGMLGGMLLTMAIRPWVAPAARPASPRD